MARDYMEELVCLDAYRALRSGVREAIDNMEKGFSLKRPRS